jgi:beta-N-acetylglucosaminidase
VSGWNVRGGSSTDSLVVGTIKNGTEVSILKSIQSEGQLTWYQVSVWLNQLREDMEYFSNPANFPESSVKNFQLLKLSESAGLDLTEVNQKILDLNNVVQSMPIKWDRQHQN